MSNESEVLQSPPVDTPAPTTLEEALARINTTADRAWELLIKAKWGFCSDGFESPYEYDQDDTLTVAYDDLYDVANIGIACMKLIGWPPEPKQA